jgi:hypothetical protein
MNGAPAPEQPLTASVLLDDAGAGLAGRLKA